MASWEVVFVVEAVSVFCEAVECGVECGVLFAL